MENSSLYIIIPLIVGYIADLIFGDPRNLPHPIVLFGNLITKCEKLFNKGQYRGIKGGVASIILITITFLIFHYLDKYIKNTNEIASYIFASLFVFYGLANKSLIKEGQEVIYKLENEGLEAGRKRLSWIVGRETKNLNKKEIYTAVLETMAENLSDGVVAPLFYYAIGGIPAMMCYKMINTLDSMIGYKNKRYKEYGMIAARIDDIANFAPARLTSLLMVIVSLKPKVMPFILKYRYKHSSPNAGYPESALAGILNCQFGGAHYYHNNLVKKPYIGYNNREIDIRDFYTTRKINHFVCLLMIILIVISF